MGVDARTVEVHDNNEIDKVVSGFCPTHAFVEALWVVPEKFNVLMSLHPDVKWYVRLHSNVPFISQEGIAMDWIKKYLELQWNHNPNFALACNSKRMVNDIGRTLGNSLYPVYSPNIYQPNYDLNDIQPKPECSILDIGCFGAIRPLKDQLIQAMAAICFADDLERTMRFHVNATRIEAYGESVYRNLKDLFKDSKHQLVTHEWLLHPKFLLLVASMDLGMQVSFSETFDIVAADFVHVNVPVIGSMEVEWLDSGYQANTTNMNDIVDKLRHAWDGRKHNHHKSNKKGLEKWNDEAREEWEELLGI
jgi:hypothetical protein